MTDLFSQLTNNGIFYTCSLEKIMYDYMLHCMCQAAYTMSFPNLRSDSEIDSYFSLKESEIALIDSQSYGITARNCIGFFQTITHFFP